MAAITDTREATRYLKHVGMDHEAPSRAPLRYVEEVFAEESFDANCSYDDRPQSRAYSTNRTPKSIETRLSRGCPFLEGSGSKRNSTQDAQSLVLSEKHVVPYSRKRNRQLKLKSS